MPAHAPLIWKHANGAYSRTLKANQLQRPGGTTGNTGVEPSVTGVSPLHSPRLARNISLSELPMEQQVLHKFEVLGMLLEGLGGVELTRHSEGEAAGGDLERRLAMLDVGIRDRTPARSGPVSKVLAS